MATLKPELKTILDRYGINPRDKSQIWDCHGTLVLYHKAYEIIAAKESIRFDPPTIIEASSEKKTVAILVAGHMGDRSEWSIGEASPTNSKNSYPYAMAEKRAKDRVIAKLVGLAAYVYSEDEADEFTTGDRKPVQHDEPPPRHNAPPSDLPDLPPPETTREVLDSLPLTDEEVSGLKTFFCGADYFLKPPCPKGSTVPHWPTWHQKAVKALRYAVSHAKSLDSVDKLVADNSLNTSGLAKADKALHADLLKRIDAARAALMPQAAE